MVIIEGRLSADSGELSGALVSKLFPVGICCLVTHLLLELASGTLKCGVVLLLVSEEISLCSFPIDPSDLCTLRACGLWWSNWLAVCPHPSQHVRDQGALC